MKFEVVTIQELIDNSFGTFTQESGTGWDLLPQAVMPVPTMTEEELMDLLEDEGEYNGELR